MIKLVKENLRIFTITLLVCIKISSQSNSYFKNNESWSGRTLITDNWNSFYINQRGKTIINSDTLIKLIRHSDYNGIDSTYLLAKNNNDTLYLYNTNQNYNAINSNLMTIDYSRTDSISHWDDNHYSARKIDSIDTVYFNGESKKLFYIPDSCSTNIDLVYEGIFDNYGTPIFDGCFEYFNFLFCYSINDSSYYVSENEFIYEKQGECTVENLSINESKKVKIDVYPNPFTDELNIKTEFFKIGVINSIDGKNIINFKINNGQAVLGLEYLPKGLYNLILLTGKQKHDLKIIKL